jgi:all-trans-nonaprenyl-diphosphate synthase
MVKQEQLSLDKFSFNDDSESDYIIELIQKIDKETFIGGKYTRSKLAVALFEDLNGELSDREALFKICRIGELLHNATLFHDDVIDESSLRRNHPSLPSSVGNKPSVLIGDYILSRAVFESTELENPLYTKNLAQTLKELVDGELLQLDLNKNSTLEDYFLLCFKKTGSLFKWFIDGVLILTGKQTDLESNFLSLRIGRAFQVADDIMDFSDHSGKEQNIDQLNDNINYVLILCSQQNLSLDATISQAINDLGEILNEIEGYLSQNSQYNFVQTKSILQKIKKKVVHEF